MVKSLTGTASVHHSVNHISPRPAMKSDRPQLFTRFCSLPPSPCSTPIAGLAIKKQGEKTSPKTCNTKASPFLWYGNERGNEGLVCPALGCGCTSLTPFQCSQLNAVVSLGPGAGDRRHETLEPGTGDHMSGSWKKTVPLEQRHWVSLALPPILAFC